VYPPGREGLAVAKQEKVQQEQAKRRSSGKVSLQKILDDVRKENAKLQNLNNELSMKISANSESQVDDEQDDVNSHSDVSSIDGEEAFRVSLKVCSTKPSPLPKKSTLPLVHSTPMKTRNSKRKDCEINSQSTDGVSATVTQRGPKRAKKNSKF